MGNCSSAPRLKVNLRTFIAGSSTAEGYGDDWYFETMNGLLDRWTYSHVQFLRKKFLEATGDTADKELDKKGFFKLFAELQDMPKAVAESAFRMFDTDNSGKLNFREFCCALALCCHLMSSDDEKIRFVFDMFDTNDDGLLSSSDVQLLLEHAIVRDDPSRVLDVDGGDKELSLLARKQQRVNEMKQELLGISQYLTFERFYEWASRNLASLTNLLHTFQIVPSPERERAICEEILSRHQTLQEGGTWYCISYKWLQVWKAHANWQGPSPGRKSRTAGSTHSGHGQIASGSSEKRIGAVELQDYDVATDVAFHGFGDGLVVGGSAQHLTRPPEVDNSDLEGEHKGILKMNLVEHLDYELIPEEMWQHLVEWYGGGPAIPRKVICMGEDSQPQVELYPPLVLVVVAGENGQPLPQFSRRFFISRQTSLEEVLHMLAEKLSRPVERSRLWHRAKGEQWHQVQQMSVMLDEFLEGKVWDAGAFLLETQKPNGEWPRDAVEGPVASDSFYESEVHRSFEVGDRVEAQNGVTNQWTRGTIVDVIQRDHSTAPSQVKVHYDSTVYKCDEWISTGSDRLAPLDTHTTEHPAVSSTATPNYPSTEGPPPIRGATGLQNLGNTCFLNATIQCLANTPLMREYFLSTRHLRDLNDRGTGCKGMLAEEFGTVLGELWSAKSAHFSPRNLKRTIDQFAPQFAGYEQHDAQELLAFFLDGLHEDLNRLGTGGGGTGSRSGGQRREAGTPKLFSRAKPRMYTGTRELSPTPKRPAKSAWRDRAVEPPPRAEPGASGGTANLMPEDTGDGLGLPDDEAVMWTGSADRIVHPTMLWSRPRFGGAFPPDNAEASGPGAGHRRRPSQGAVGVADEGSEQTRPDNEESAEAGGPAPTGDEVDGPKSWKETDALLLLTEEFGDEHLSQDAPLTHFNERKAVQASAGNFQQSPWEPRRGDKDDDDRNSTGRPQEAAAQDIADLGSPVGSRRGSGIGGVNAHRVSGRGMDVADEAKAGEVAGPLDAPGAGPTAALGAVASGAAAAPAARRENGSSDVKRPGTSRWWSFAWRRGRGALDLPKEPNLEPGPIEAEKKDGAQQPPPPRATPASGVVGVATVRGGAGGTAVPTAPLPPPSAVAPAVSTVTGLDDTGSEEATEHSSHIVSIDGRIGATKEDLPHGCDIDLPVPQEWSRSTPEAALDTPANQLDEPSKAKLPAGPGTAAVTAAAALRGSGPEGSEDGAVGIFNESEDFVPELLTPQPSNNTSRRSLNLFNWRKKRADDGESSNPARRPKTPPTMTTLQEEQPSGSTGQAIEPKGDEPAPEPSVAETPGFNNTQSGETAPSGGSGAGSGVGSGSGTPTSRSFLPWKGKRNVQDQNRSGSGGGPREGPWEGTVREDTESSRAGASQQGDRAGSRDGARVGRTKEKESAWPSFLRRSKSREGISSRRSRPTGPRAPGTVPPAPSGDRGVETATQEQQRSEEPQATSEAQGQGEEEEDAEADEDNLPDEEKAARQWERYRASNRSLIVDVFEGQLRSQITCCQCGASSTKFEPFRYLSVPIPSNHVDRATLRVVFFPVPFSRGEERPQLQRFSVCVPKSSTVQKVEWALSRLLPVPMTVVLLAEVYRSRIHRYLDTSLPLSDVRAEDQLFAFEVLQTPQELAQYQEQYAPSRQRRERLEEPKKQPLSRVLLIQAMHRRVVDFCRSDGRTWGQRREVFGLPFVMSAASSWTYATLHDMLMLHGRRFLKTVPRRERRDAAPAAGSGAAAGGAADDRQVPFVARIVNMSGTACGACDRQNCTGCLLPKGNSKLRLRAGLLTGSVSTAKIYLALDWVDSSAYDQEYVDNIADDASVARANAIEVQGEGEEPDTERSHGSSAPRVSLGEQHEEGEGASAGKVLISTCIDAFAQPEELKVELGNGFKCEKCNQVVDAVKKLEIWREPDVLILHIKRFHFSGVHYEKLNTPVEIPSRELNLRPWIVGPSASNAAPFELYAVACHFGGMSGGHYTSYCANNEGKEPVWLNFNDDTVHSVSFRQELDEIARQCYVLFYRKRAFSSSNLINYSSLV